jgi:hypothetical protein
MSVGAMVIFSFFGGMIFGGAMALLAAYSSRR